MSTSTPTPSAEATPTREDPSPAICCGRRAVLRAAGLVALSGGAVALAACSADSSTTSPSTGAGSAEPTAVAISEVAVGGGLVVQEKYVVTQPTDGEFKAFSAICTHQGCPVGSVEDGAIICPCHNSHFDISTGDPVEGPAQQPLAAAKLTRSGDKVYVSG